MQALMEKSHPRLTQMAIRRIAICLGLIIFMAAPAPSALAQAGKPTPDGKPAPTSQTTKKKTVRKAKPAKIKTPVPAKKPSATPPPSKAPEPQAAPAQATPTPSAPAAAKTAPQAKTPKPDPSLGKAKITLAARLTDKSEQLNQGVVWRIYAQNEKTKALDLIAQSEGGTTTVDLDPGIYLAHATFGMAGRTKRILAEGKARTEEFILNAGGLKLNAGIIQGDAPEAQHTIFEIAASDVDERGERTVLVKNAKDNKIIRLNAGTYHIISRYGDINAVVRADIHVEAGKVTTATLYHRAAQITLKLVSESGGEALAGTRWSLLTPGGDVVKESLGAFPVYILAEGDYTAIARNGDKVYNKDFSVTSGLNREVEIEAK